MKMLKNLLLASNGLLFLALSSWSGNVLALTFNLNCQKPEAGTAACNNTGLNWGDMTLNDSVTDPLSSNTSAANYLDIVVDLTGTGQKVQEILLNIDSSSLTVPSDNLWRAWLVSGTTTTEINQNKISYDPDNLTGGGGPNLGFFDLQINDSNFEPVHLIVGLFDDKNTNLTSDDIQKDLNPSQFDIANSEGLKTYVHIGACGGGTDPYLCSPGKSGSQSIWVGSRNDGTTGNAEIPEPDMLALLGIGLLGLAGTSLRRRWVSHQQG